MRHEYYNRQAVSEFHKRYIRLHISKCGPVQIADRLSLPYSTVAYWFKRYTGKIGPVSVPPRPMSELTKREIRNEIRAISLNAHKWPSLMNGAKDRIKQLEKQLNGKFI